MTTALPAPLQTGRVTGHVSAVIADSPADPDTDPDLVAVPGLKATFKPTPAVMLAPSIKRSLLPQTIVANFDDQGVLRHNGQPYLDLIATDLEEVSPARWTWTVTITAPSIPPWTFSFELPAGQTKDLSELAPVSSTNGIPIVRGPSPYEVWLSEGNVGTFEDFLTTLQGSTPVLVGGATATLPPGAAALATLVPIGEAEYRVDIALPKGEPGGSDGATAGWIEGGTETRAALTSVLSAAVAPQVEKQPLWVTGHSWVAGLADAVQWWERLAQRINAPTTVAAGYSGRTIGDVSALALSGTNAWTVRASTFFAAVCTINDLTLHLGTAASRRGYAHAWRSLLSLVTSNYVTAANTADVVYSPGWTKVPVLRTTNAGTSTNSTGGDQFTTTSVGSYFEFAATGPSVDVVLMARAAGAGLATATIGGTTVGTLDLTLSTAQDTPAVLRLRGLGSGTRTIRVTLTSGARMTLDSIRIPSTTPVSGVVFGEPNITATNYPAYLADLASFKADLAAIVTEYPTIEWLDLAQDPTFNAGFHLYDGKHPSDPGADWIAAHVLRAAAGTPWTPLMHRLSTSAAAEYVPPTPPPLPAGGQPGSGPLPPLMTDTPPYSGTTDTGGMTWSALSNASHSYNTVDTGAADVIVKATLSAIDPDAAPGAPVAGLAFRVGDIDNGIHLSVRTDTYAFTRYNAGTHATLNQTAALAPQVGDVIELRGRGVVVECWVNGSKIYEHLNLTAAATNTKHGFMATTATADTAFSSITITPNP